MSVFVRLGPKGKEQMRINTETRKVSVCIVFDSYNVSVKLTISIMPSQFVMQTIVSTKEHVMEHYPSDPVGWGMAIDLLHELAMERDIKRFSVYCAGNDYDKYLGEDDSEIFKSWVGVYMGEIKHYIIRYGISGRFIK